MSDYIKEIKSIAVDSYGEVRTLVRGLPYQCPDDWETVLGSLNKGSELYLIKEPNNPKDKLAIAAYLGCRRIGYVSADDNCQVWMFLTDKKTPCRLLQKYEASFKVAFDNPRPLFQKMTFEDIYKDREGWIEKGHPIMKVPFLKDKEDETYDWFRDTIFIIDFEDYIPDFRRKLASKMITFIARKNSQGNYRYYLPYINAAVAEVCDNKLKEFIDADGFIIAVPDLSSKTYQGIRVVLNVARLKKGNPLLKEFKSVNEKGGNELVFYLKPPSVIVNDKKNSKQSPVNAKSKRSCQINKKISVDLNSPEYFDKIDKLTTDLYVFVNDTLLKSRRVLKEMDNHPCYGHRYRSLKDYKMFVKIFVMTDLYHIYKELKCKLGAFSNEGRIIFLYGMKVLGEDTNVNLDIFREMCNPASDIDVIVNYRILIDNFITNGYNENVPYYPSKGFLMQEVLETGNIELMDMSVVYVELMSKFASAVAEAKGKLTAKEKKWLSQMAL